MEECDEELLLSSADAGTQETALAPASLALFSSSLDHFYLPGRLPVARSSLPVTRGAGERKPCSLASLAAVVGLSETAAPADGE